MEQFRKQYLRCTLSAKYTNHETNCELFFFNVPLNNRVISGL
jgi:hypothetical protein